jgi:hypothetical protein
VHFRIFHNILSLASPIYNNMFSIPLPPSQKPDEVQVVRLSEDSGALDVALRHIYPVRPPKVVDTLHFAGILAEFARKYQVETLDNFIIGYLTDSIKSDPAFMPSPLHMNTTTLGQTLLGHVYTPRFLNSSLRICDA